MQPANVQVGQMVSSSSSHLAVPTVAGVPPPWEEVWPPNTSLLHESPQDTSAFSHWELYNSTPPGLTPTPDTPPGVASTPDTLGFASRMSVYLNSASDCNKQDKLGTILEGDATRHKFVASHHRATFANSTSLHSHHVATPHVATPHVATPHVATPPDPHHVATPPLFCVSVNKSRESLAKVETPQAQDLSYHQKGTFHWDPFINSSLLDDSDASVMTFIVQYLTPHRT